MLGLISFSGMVGCGPVEVARAVGAGGHAVAAADAPVVIDHHDAVLLRPGGAGGADLGAGRILALLAGHRDVEVAFLGNLGGMVVGVGVREIHALFLLHREDADPVDLRIARLVVLVHAGIDAAAAADAARDIQRIGEMHARDGAGIGDVDVLAVLALCTCAPSRRCAPCSWSLGASYRRLGPQAVRIHARRQRRRRFRREEACVLTIGVSPGAHFDGSRLGGRGAGLGASAWKRGWCGLWQWAHSR